jgi:ATP-dependent DNA ligase
MLLPFFGSRMSRFDLADDVKSMPSSSAASLLLFDLLVLLDDLGLPLEERRRRLLPSAESADEERDDRREPFESFEFMELERLSLDEDGE